MCSFTGKVMNSWRTSLILVMVFGMLGILFLFLRDEPVNDEIRHADAQSTTSNPNPARHAKQESDRQADEGMARSTPSPGSFIVEGRVVDDSGRALAGAPIRLVEAGRRDPAVALRTMPALISAIRQHERDIASIESDSRGRFLHRLETPVLFRLHVDLPGYRPYESATLRVSNRHRREFVEVRLSESTDRDCIVEDLSQRPLSGVRIDYVVPPTPFTGPGGGHPSLISTTSDEEGRFRLRAYGSRKPPEGAYIRLSKPGYVARIHTLVVDVPAMDRDGRFHFVLLKGRHFDVRFVPRSGTLKGPLTFTLAMTGAGSSFHAGGRSDEKGLAGLDGLPSGKELRIRLLDDDWCVAAPEGPTTRWDSTIGFAFAIPEEGDVKLVVDVVPTKRIRGRLVDIDTGEGVKNVGLVWGRGLEWDVMAGIAGQCVTDNLGDFELHGIGSLPTQLMILTPQWRLVAGADLHGSLATADALGAEITRAGTHGTNSGDARPLFLRMLSPLMLEAEPPPDDVTVPLTIFVRREAEYRGRVLGPDGIPIEGASVTPNWRNHFRELTVVDHLRLKSHWKVRSGPDGRFRIATSGARGSIVVRHPGYATKRIELQGAPAEPHDLGDIVLSELVPVEIAVVREDGTGIPGVHLQVRPGSQLQFTERADYRFATTDESGRAQVLLPHGPASVQWSFPVREDRLIPAPSTLRGFDVRAPKTEVSLRFTRGHLLRCTVVDESGRPAAHFTLTIVRLDDQGNVVPGKFPVGAVIEGGYAMGTLTDAGGGAQLLVPFPGRYRVVSGNTSRPSALQAGMSSNLEFLSDTTLIADGPPTVIRVRGGL